MSSLAMSDPPAPGATPSTLLESGYARFLHLENSIHHQLVKHSITGLRLALGIIFLGFGVLKYFGGISPAQTIVEMTTHILFIGLIPGAVALRIIATLECVIGLCLLSNRGMRLAVWLLGIEFIGILSPIFLFPAHLFSGPDHAPTLLAQYCLKDIILVAGGLVVTAGSFRGGRMIRADLPPRIRAARVIITEPEEKLAIVLEGIGHPEQLQAALRRHQITESEFHQWRDSVLLGARSALCQPPAAGTEPLSGTQATAHLTEPPAPASESPSGRTRRRRASLVAGAALMFMAILG